MPENINIERDQHNITISEPMRDYHLPIASETVLGGIKVGNNLTIEEDGTLNAESTEYTLPTASASTLGGVKVGGNLNINNGILTADVDSVLSGSSTNPVQNSVVTSNISSINSELGQLDTRTDNLENSVSTLSSTVTSQGTAITGLGNDISALQTAVETNTSNIGTNTGNISANAQAISDLDDRLDTAEDNITSQGNAINEMAGEINDFTLTSDTDVEYSYLLPVNTWSQGKITYSRRGKIGLISFDLNGDMNLAANTETQIYQLPATFENSIICKGTLNTNVGPLTVTLDTNRNISFANITASAMNQITKVRGQLVVVLE
jgi:prefoldin subunit 5